MTCFKSIRGNGGNPYLLSGLYHNLVVDHNASNTSLFYPAFLFIFFCSNEYRVTHSWSEATCSAGCIDIEFLLVQMEAVWRNNDTIQYIA